MTTESLIKRGKGALLYDADGREYLDCYNNVASVLNTHTRYLHENVVKYAERLTTMLTTATRWLSPSCPPRNTRPPMVFSKANADELLEKLSQALEF